MNSEFRKITKIARVTSQFVTKKQGKLGLNENERLALHYVRHHKGCSQRNVSDELCIDKALVTRICTKLIQNGWIEKKESELDHRAYQLYALPKAEEEKNEITSLETLFYEEITKELSQEEKEAFLIILDKIYLKSKQERKSNYENM